MKHLLTSTTALPAAALLAAVGPHHSVTASPVSNLVSDLVVTAETEGIQLPFTPAIESDFQRDTTFLDDPGASEVSVSSVVALSEVTAEADGSAAMTFTTDDDTATFLYALEGFAFGSLTETGDDFGATASFSASIETEFTITEPVDYVFTASLGRIVGGAELELELFNDDSGELVDLFGPDEGPASGVLTEGTYIGLFSLTGAADAGVFSTDFVDGSFSATLEINPDLEAPAGDENASSGELPGETDTDTGGLVEATPIPTPTAVLAGLVGLGVVVCRRRRA
ncbi:MAG: PTPA-CTERM sorting domain-containing protein [Planctomycetota bacterium]